MTPGKVDVKSNAKVSDVCFPEKNGIVHFHKTKKSVSSSGEYKGLAFAAFNAIFHSLVLL